MAPQPGKMRHNVVVDFRTRITFADDESASIEIAPIDLPLCSQPVGPRECDQDAFIPKMLAVAAINGVDARQECDVELDAAARQRCGLKALLR